MDPREIETGMLAQLLRQHRPPTAADAERLAIRHNLPHADIADALHLAQEYLATTLPNGTETYELRPIPHPYPHNALDYRYRAPNARPGLDFHVLVTVAATPARQLRMARQALYGWQLEIGAIRTLGNR